MCINDRIITPLKRVSTLKGMTAIKFMRVSFGCNRRRTREKTQASKEKATKEDLEKDRSPVTCNSSVEFCQKCGATEAFWESELLQL
ncbi:hypothetical protein MUO79_04225 [Candidatus Bathyarchaeota archaeon]|nr:hypothetical protein [Candidatus Bathyarchaeota archaeon]